MELKDVLHYYMGCRYSFSDGNGIVNELTLVAIKLAMDGGIKVKPHLRRLEDMTEEEAREYLSVFSVTREYLSHDGYGVYWMGRSVSSAVMMFNSGPIECFHYLLAHGFDLFGLIASGQAVDAKTVQP